MRYSKNTDELSALEDSRNLSARYNPDTNEFEYQDEWGRTREEILEDYQEQADKLNAVSAVYQRADRIITGEDITVSVVSDPNMNTTAMSNGKEIIFNSDLIEDLTTDSLISFNGLNYHEIAHVLFSPRAGSDLGKWARENKVINALNVLEEGRVEGLLTAKYPATKVFLEASTLDYVLKGDSKEWGEHFHLTTGRTYLPLELRQLIADKFIARHGIALAEEMHLLIHTYKAFAFPADFDKAKDIAVRMANIIGFDDPNEQNPKAPHTDRSLGTKGRPAGQKEQNQLQDKNKGEGSELEQLNAPAIGAGGKDSPEYTGEDLDFTEEDAKIAKVIEERLQEIRDDSDVKREVSETRKAIINSDETRSAMRNAIYRDQAPRTNSVALARRFGIQLERIAKDSEPHWDKFNSSGKLNVSRTMTPDVNAIGEMFDTWDTGNPATDIEAVILTDNSSSMGGRMTAVNENAWIIKRGIENIDGAVTVYTFNHESRLVYSRNEKAKGSNYRYVQSGGSTNPIRALIESQRLLGNSKKAIKIAFIVTDGEWEMSDECNSIIKEMNAKGILTCVVFIGNYEYYRQIIEASNTGDKSAKEQLQSIRHFAKVFKTVAKASDVLGVATELVKEALRGR